MLRRTISLLVVATVTFGVLAATTAWSSDTVAAAGTACLDWTDYADGSAPVGSDSLGAPGGDSDTTDGEQRTLTEVFGQPIDLRITWVDEHRGVMLDTTTGGDFTGVDDYTDLLGGGGSTSVLRYFPRPDGGGEVHFEFFETGTTNRVEVEIDQLLIGGHRDFPTRPEGVSELALTTGGPAGARVASTFADPDSVAVDTDPADGITGLGTEPIIELDTADYGTANNTAWNEARNSYVSVGAFQERDWTILDWGDARADTIVWTLYGSDPNDDPETVDPAVSAFHDGLSSYISGFCFTPDTYDLALTKTVGAAPTDLGPGAEVRFDVTVTNQSTDVASVSVVDHVQAGFDFDPADNPDGTVSDSGGDPYALTWDTTDPDAPVARIAATSGALSDGETVTIPVVLSVASDWDGSDLLNFAEISNFDDDLDTGNGDGASGALTDVDSTPDTDPSNDNQPAAPGAAGDDVISGDGSGTDPVAGDEDDHDLAGLDAGTLSLGNQVWLDADNDGVIDAGESGIPGVTVALFTDADDDGVADGCDDGALELADALATTTTDADGRYLFSGLAAGAYVVGVPPSSWAPDGALYGHLSSTATATDPDGDIDGDDDGAPGCGGWVVTGAVTLGDGEPTGESPGSGGATPDVRENLTVDLGFWAPEFDLALRKQLADGTNSATVRPGDAVTFRITIVNQGSIDATGVTVVDYVPEGLILDDSNWSLDGGQATTTLAGTLAAGATATVDITFRIADGATGSIENTAEISGAVPTDDGVEVRMPNDVLLPDIDSVADRTDAENPIDDEIDGGGGDEDDHDGARLEVDTGSGGGGGDGPGELPRTGSEPRPMIVWAAALMVAGLFLLGLRPDEA